MARLIGAIAILSVFLFGSCKLLERSHHLSFVPEGLSVSTILYTKEQSWGFGPGGNETGLIVYELPDSIAKEIQKVGLGYFTNLPQKKGDSSDSRGRYETWQSTPILLKGSGSGAVTTNSYEIANFLNRYGFGISIDSQIEQEVNRAISTPGSFYANGRIGILIVIPDIRRVVYAYNG
jgi:hypothetical protein